MALWNGCDPILKERLFGLAGDHGNHGEDVKEYYYYLDNTPTHSYMKYLYRYPQAAFPYEQLVDENRRRSRLVPEYELVDTGIFAEGRYFDVEVEYAKWAAEDLLIRIGVSNRGDLPAVLDVLPTLWFRNTWSWGRDDRRPVIRAAADKAGAVPSPGNLLAEHWQLGPYVLYCGGADELLFTENESDNERLFRAPSASPYVKDAFHAYVVGGQRGAVNPAQTGTKAASRYRRTLDPGESWVVQLRLAAPGAEGMQATPLDQFDTIMDQRRQEADAFYEAALPATMTDDARRVARQALAGLLWSKQYYHYVVHDWLEGDPSEPIPPPQRRIERNHDWKHLFARDVISMPDKWEFPWFASWDLGFHCIALAHIDPQFAKDQIILMLREWMMHPNGQIPAYEWDFGAANPPMLPLAALSVFDIERQMTGVGDHAFLERVFQKMLLNFTWWVNRKDAMGKNIFQGGFLGMDNIGPFNRDVIPAGYRLEQADGTGWMAAFAKSMLSIALLLAEQDAVYEDLASKFWEHYISIASAMNGQGTAGKSLWDERDGFFYDHLVAPSGQRMPVRARTMVGFVPLFGAQAVPADTFDRYPGFQRRRAWFIKHRPDLIQSVEPMVVPGPNQTVILGMVRADQLRRMLTHMLDEREFLSPHGVRSVSQYHRDHPLDLDLDGYRYRLDYEPGESTTDLYGGNSNWRGPIWLPVNFLIMIALKQYHAYYGDTFRVACPTGSNQMMTLDEVSRELARRLSRLFLLDEHGRRAYLGSIPLFQNDPSWRDRILYYEFFDGDTGRGCGASHQTGWTGLIAPILMGLAQ